MQNSRKRGTTSGRTYTWNSAATKRRRMIGGKRRYYKPMTRRLRAPTEVKSFDLNFDLATLANGTMVGEGSVAGVGADNGFDTGMTCINLIQAGSAFYNRIGGKICIKSIDITGWLEQGATATYMAKIRYLIVYDRQANGAYPALQALLQDNDGALTFNSGVNMQNRSRFSIIRDKRISIDSGTQLQYCIKEYCKGMWECDYGTTTGLIGDVRSGALYFIAFGQNFGAGGNDASVPIAIKSRVRYYDN
nr:MAG: putative capsid protein [Arizlama virus]